MILVKSMFLIVDSKDPIARKMRLRRRRDQEEADQDQAKILKVRHRLINHVAVFVYRETHNDDCFQGMKDIAKEKNKDKECEESKAESLK